MAEQFYTILTKVGKAKIANAAALGTQINLVKFHVGDGNGSYYSPTEEQTQLENKVWEGNISSIRIDDENPNWIILESVIPGTDGGFMVREVGAVDAEGNLIAIGKFPETYKPAAGDGSIKDLILKMVLEVSNTSSVTLKIDPTVILASKKDVLDLEKKVNKLENTVNTLELVDTKVKLTDPDNLFEFEEQPNINQAILANKTSILSLEEDAGDLTNLQTNNKASLVAAINEVFQSANNGKDIIANAIGSPLVNSDAFSVMVEKIDTLTQTFQNTLTEKGVDVLPDDKMLTLIGKVGDVEVIPNVIAGDSTVIFGTIEKIGSTSSTPGYWNYDLIKFCVNGSVRLNFDIYTSRRYGKFKFILTSKDGHVKHESPVFEGISEQTTLYTYDIDNIENGDVLSLDVTGMNSSYASSLNRLKISCDGI